MAKDNLREASCFSPMLSGFIKIVQLLVIQKAVVTAREAESTYAADILDELRLRFLTHGTRSPFSWAVKL